MKKNIFLFAITILIIIISLAGCGKSELDNYLNQSTETVRIMEYNYKYINYVKGEAFLSIDDVEASYLVVFTHPEYVASLSFANEVLPKYVESEAMEPFKIYLVNLSFKEHEDIWEDYQLQVLPTTFLIQNGTIIKRITGFVTEDKLPYKGDLPEEEIAVDEDEGEGVLEDEEAPEA